MALYPDLQSDVGRRARNAQDYITVGDLAVVEGDLSALIHRAGLQFRRAGNAAAIFTAIGQIDAPGP